MKNHAACSKLDDKLKKPRYKQFNQNEKYRRIKLLNARKRLINNSYINLGFKQTKQTPLSTHQSLSNESNVSSSSKDLIVLNEMTNEAGKRTQEVQVITIERADEDRRLSTGEMSQSDEEIEANDYLDSGSAHAKTSSKKCPITVASINNRPCDMTNTEVIFMNEDSAKNSDDVNTNATDEFDENPNTTSGATMIQTRWISRAFGESKHKGSDTLTNSHFKATAKCAVCLDAASGTRYV